MAESCLGEIVDVLGRGVGGALFLEQAGCTRQLPGAARQVRASRPSPWRTPPASTERRSRAGARSARAAGDGGLYVPVRSPSGVTGVLTVQARRDGRAYSAADARS